MGQISFLILLLSLIVLCPAKITFARWSLTPRLSFLEQYDDNIFLTETDEQEDYISIIAPGVGLTYETPTSEVYLDYEFTHNNYRNFSELNFNGHRALLDANIDFSPRFSLGIWELFVRSNDPIDESGRSVFERPSIRPGLRSRYTRNIFIPEATFRFGDGRSITLEYRNGTLRNDAVDRADQDENDVNALLSYRLNAHNELEFFYEHIDMEYGSTTPPELPRSFRGNAVRGKYSYHFNPITSVFLESLYFDKDLLEESPAFFDYNIYNQRFGFSRKVLEHLSLEASAGYALRTSSDRDDESTFTSRLRLFGRFKSLEGRVYGATGFDDDFRTVEALGFSEFWRAGIDGRLQLQEKLWLGLEARVRRDDYVDRGRIDKLRKYRANITYEPFKWIALSFRYERNERDSNTPSESFENNRYLFSITFQYDVAERLQ
ncbi:MAG: outer membrane beta-barrel protein [Candidatus Bathyarchaeota archaeon]|nr:MAG: outer membrane beta-barrel protein [Candidatus Bathyarchaeota archaeon]